MKNNNILKSSFFLKLFGIPYITWFILSLTTMIPDKNDTDPLTWGELFTGDIGLLIIWFIISFIVSFIVNKTKNNRKKSTKEIKDIDKPSEKIIIKDDIEKKKIKTKLNKMDKNHNFIQKGMLILFVITLLSFYGAIYSFALMNEINPKHGFSFIKNAWVFWCWLPIPILSIVLGFKYKNAGFKCTKNIVAGFIIGFLLLIYGAFCLFPTFSQDYSKINEYRDVIDAKLPDNGELEIQNWNVNSDVDKKEYLVINAYYSKEDVSDLVKSIKNSNNWILSTEIKSSLKIFIPFTFYPSNDSYFSIFNKTLNEYNKVPDESGEYEIYVIKYDISDKQLEIHKFKYNYKK